MFLSLHSDSSRHVSLVRPANVETCGSLGTVNRAMDLIFAAYAATDGPPPDFASLAPSLPCMRLRYGTGESKSAHHHHWARRSLPPLLQIQSAHIVRKVSHYAHLIFAGPLAIAPPKERVQPRRGHVYHYHHHYHHHHHHHPDIRERRNADKGNEEAFDQRVEECGIHHVEVEWLWCVYMLPPRTGGAARTRLTDIRQSTRGRS